MIERLSWPPPRRVLFVAGAIGAFALVAAVGYWLGTRNASTSEQAAHQDGRRILYWYDPMVPDQHFDRPGRSPFMDMDLVPRYADEAAAEAGVRISPGVAQNLGVRLVVVERGPVARSVMAAGVIAFNERNVAIVQARAGGFVERTYRRAPGDVVAAGAPIVDLRVPEWTAAQAEYLAVRSSGGEIAEAARRRLTMLGMPAELIARVERDGAPRPVITITSPIAGAITSLDVRQGMSIAQGAPIATVSGLSPIWLVVSLPQAEAALARPGARVRATLPAYPGENFSGRIETVLPAADPTTRTVEVRIALDNRHGRLRPGMTAEVRIEEAPQTALMVPAEAVIRTGLRSVVIVGADGGGFAPTEVRLGRQSGDAVEIVAGLSEGQRVVASGQFLIDSEANLSGAIARLNATQQAAAAQLHETTGRIVSLQGQTAMIEHPPVPSLRWPGMTMQFNFARPELMRGLTPGDRVSFRFRQEGRTYIIEEIRETGADR